MVTKLWDSSESDAIEYGETRRHLILGYFTEPFNEFLVKRGTRQHDTTGSSTCSQDEGS
jgi:hypothetical protein